MTLPDAQDKYGFSIQMYRNLEEAMAWLELLSGLYFCKITFLLHHFLPLVSVILPLVPGTYVAILYHLSEKALIQPEHCSAVLAGWPLLTVP